MDERPTAYWDDAYTNSAYIENGGAYPARWAAEAAAFRDRMTLQGLCQLDISYGLDERQRLDLFRPQGEPKGLVVFIHGGYWLQFDRRSFSHLAAGPLAAGHAVAMPSYRLCPNVRISAITQDVGAAVTAAAAMVAGPLRVAGHSAGGHLATRMVAENSPLAEAIRSRIARVVSISGLHDLEQLTHTKMNERLKIDAAEVVQESPALHPATHRCDIVFWVGLAERPEFLRQSRLMRQAWAGSAATVSIEEEPARHHFDVIDGLADADSPLARALLGA